MCVWAAMVTVTKHWLLAELSKDIFNSDTKEQGRWSRPDWPTSSSVLDN